MKQCIRCKNIVNDNEQFCPKCGGMQFNFGQNSQQQQRPVQPRPIQPRQNQQQLGNQIQTNQNYNQQQQYQQNIYNQQQQYQNQQNIPNQYNQQNTYNNQYNNNNGNFVQPNNMYNNQYENSQNQYQQNNIQQNRNKKTKRISKKEQQNREMQMMLAMKAAKEKGEPFSKEQFYIEHGWDLPENSNGVNQYQGNTNSNVSSEGSVKDWIITLLLLIIPIANIFILVYNMHSMKNSEYKRNFYKAYLIYYVATLLLSIAITFIL